MYLLDMWTNDYCIIGYLVTFLMSSLHDINKVMGVGVPGLKLMDRVWIRLGDNCVKWVGSSTELCG